MITLQNNHARIGLLPEIGGTVLYFDVLIDGAWQALFRQTQGDPRLATDCACFPMAPFCGRIRDGRFNFDGRTISLSPNKEGQRHTLHGQAWQRAWKLDEQRTDEARISMVHEPGEWPWRYEVQQHFRLDGAALEMTMVIRNLDSTTMPASFGFHPYFDKTSPVLLSTYARDVWMIDDEAMPTELVPAQGDWSLGPDKPLADFVCDQNFQHWSREAEIRWPERGIVASVTASPAFPSLVIYCPRGEPFFCLEPAGNVADAVNFPATGDPAVDMPVLAAGERREGMVRIAVRKTP